MYLAARLLGHWFWQNPSFRRWPNHGVLFLDKLAEFSRVVLDLLRQPLETGPIVVARANHHVTYPARFQLVAAMNPRCCGYLGNPARACSRASACGQNYQAKISGPIMDRFDLIIEVPEISASTLLKEASGESSQIVATRLAVARQLGACRNQGVMCANAHISIDQLDQQTMMDVAAQDLLRTAMDQANLSARAYHKIMRVSRTIADHAEDDRVGRVALAEALAYLAMPLLA
jgi:magnesium chelatase family protein